MKMIVITLRKLGEFEVSYDLFTCFQEDKRSIGSNAHEDKDTVQTSINNACDKENRAITIQYIT